MDEEMMNAENPEVVQPGRMGEQLSDSEVNSPETDNGADTGDVANPRDIESMSDDDFAEYLQQVQNGTLPQPEEPSAEEGEAADAAESAEEPGDTDPQNDDAEIKPYKVYKTHEEFQQDFDRIMGGRLKNNREDLDLLSKLKIQARNFYGDAADDNAAVMALLNDLTNQNADKRGVETEEYNRQTQDAEDARRWREQQSQTATQEQQRTAQRERLQRDIADVKRIVPTFDFQKAMENETFRNAIASGASVQTAYMIANQPKPQKPKRQLIKQVGMQTGVSGQSDYDPARLPTSDFNAYIDRIMNR